MATEFSHFVCEGKVLVRSCSFSAVCLMYTPEAFCQEQVMHWCLFVYVVTVT